MQTRKFDEIKNYKHTINQLVGDYKEYLKNNVDKIVCSNIGYEQIRQISIDNIHHNFLIVTNEGTRGTYNISHAFQLLDEVIMIYN